LYAALHVGDPDKRVREALHLTFHKFAEFAGVRQVTIWLCDEDIKMPIVVYGPRGRMVEWQLPSPHDSSSLMGKGVSGALSRAKLPTATLRSDKKASQF
jgi:hypothetical protein